MAEQAPTLQDLEAVPGPQEHERAADTIRAVMERMGGDGADKGSQEAAPETEETPEEPVAKEQDRDERGRFKARDDGGEEQPAAEGEEASAAEADEGAGEPPEGKEQDAADTDDDLEPPTEWHVDYQEMFRSLPKEGKQFLKQAYDHVKGVYDQTAQTAQYYNNLEQVLAPRRQEWHRNGLDETTAVRQLLALSDLATEKPLDFVQMFVRERQLKPEDVFPQAGKTGEDEYADPDIASLRQELMQTRQELDSIKNGFTTQEQEAQRQQRQQLVQEIEQFRTETDERGRPKRPYFEEVKGLMGPLLGSGSAPDIQTAYDMACHANPDVRAKIAAAHRAQEERERARKEREKAEAARRAGTSISGTPGDRSVPEPSGDIREDMRRQFQARGLL